jgi:hypothetical protein
MIRLLALAFAIGALASCGRPVPFEPCRVSADTVYTDAGTVLAIVTARTSGCGKSAQLRHDPLDPAPTPEHDSPPEHITCALRPVEHEWTILGITYTETVEQCH